ncbi:hypothetical protein J4E89_002662 [Alternaria sp. Ai002NY15]|nr:hypothetical protein J4E89_002662 [Alternaria sp. Ai002NY15]
MNTIMLRARNNLERRDDSKTCPLEDAHGPQIIPFIGNLTFHQFATILSGACAILSTLIVGALIALHAFNYSNPVQQRQIIRIMLLIPWVALFSFLIVWQSDIGEYLAPSRDFGCSIALSSFLLFMCDLVLSHQEGFDGLFGEGAKAKGARKMNSPTWLRRTWYGVLQFIPTSIVIWIATAATLATGTYCQQSNDVHFAHLWLTILIGYTTTVAIVGSLRFYKKSKKLLQKHRIILKLFTFKGILGLNFLQSFIISLLAGHGKLNPTKYMTYHDVNTGLASLILACEMPLFAVLLLFAFSPLPYKQQGSPTAGPLNAIVDAFNLSDLLSAFYRGPMRLVRDQQTQIRRQESVRIALVSSSDEEERRGCSVPSFLLLAKVLVLKIESISTTTQRPYSHLPAELWAQILHHVEDEYTLWVICRQVSRTFRAEAEREFAKTRLPQLRINWASMGEIMHENRLHEFDCNVEDLEFQGLTEDGLRAQFTAAFEYELRNLEGRPEYVRTLYDRTQYKPLLEKTFAELIPFRYLDFKKRVDRQYWTRQMALIGGYVSNAQLTEVSIDLDNKTIAFDWKTFLNDFFQLTTYVRARRQTQGTVSDLAKQAFEAFRLQKSPYTKTRLDTLRLERKSWVHVYGEEDDDCHTEGYFRRLQSAHSEAGLDFDLNNMIDGMDEAEIRKTEVKATALMRLFRNIRLMNSFRDGYECDGSNRGSS